MKLNKVMRIFIIFLLLVSGLSNGIYGQRGKGGGIIGKKGTVTLTPTITHATCFNEIGSVDYLITVSSGWNKYTKVNFINLTNSDGDIVYNSNNPSATGSVGNLSIGNYTFSGSVTTTSSSGFFISIPFSVSIWIGIETVWSEMNDMIENPNSYSAKRNVTNQTYGGAISSNAISSSDGWIEMKAVYGSSSYSFLYWIIGETSNLNSFDPNGTQQYVQFSSAFNGTGISVRYLNQGVYTTTVISTNINDKIRLVRTGTTVTIQKNNDNTTIFTFPTPYSGPMNIGIFTRSINDGCVDVISSFGCVKPITVPLYAHLKYELDGYYHVMKEGKINFLFNQEYDASILKFNIYDVNSNLIKTDSDFPIIPTTNGDNYITIDVSGVSNCIDKDFYYLEVISNKKEKMYLRFLNDFVVSGCQDNTINNNPSQ